MNKSQKMESKYLTEVFNHLTGKFTEKELEQVQKAFNTFASNMKIDKIGLLRKGEVMLRRILI